ncbi:MAG: hypothetical protein HFG20_10100 [Anaerotruncus sp.]|nr:hypothetical protein [Anaerotruncus sp.]
MKKIIAGLLASAMALSMSLPAFAAVVTKEVAIEKVCGRMVFDDGRQLSAKDYGSSVAPDQTIYYAMPRSLTDLLAGSKDYRLNVRKIKNAKMVKSVKIVEKKLAESNTTIYLPDNANTNVSLPATDAKAKTPNLYDTFNSFNRLTYLAVDLNDMTGSEELKVEIEATITTKKAKELFYGDSTLSNSPSDRQKLLEKGVGNKLTLKINLYVANPKDESGDAEIVVGKNGTTVKPLKNEQNIVTFESDGTMAILEFNANSNPEKFYAKLTTKWTSELLRTFRDTDAVIRKFSAATIPATSRAKLMLINPFDPDEIEPESIYIYQVNAKGGLSNVTSSFWYDADEDAFCTRTRTLGTWVLSNERVKTTA